MHYSDDEKNVPGDCMLTDIPEQYARPSGRLRTVRKLDG